MSKLLTPYRQLAPAAAVRVSPVCLGSMTFGNQHLETYGECSDDTAYKILDYFYENGGNFIDTSNTYQDGESEVLLGKWMASRKNKDEIVLATKYSSPYDFDCNIKVNVVGNNAKSMKLSLMRSLNRLQTSYIDLFYVHWWDYTTSIPELMLALNDLVVSGKVIYLGISDAPAWIVTKANEYARAHGLRQFSVYQGYWNAAFRDFERDIIPMCAAEGMAMCPYGTLNQGRFQTEEVFKEREKNNPGRKFAALSQRDKDVSKCLEKVAKSKGVTLFTVALSYILHRAPYVFPIIGARKVEHVKGNLPALKLALTPEEIEEIDSAYLFDHGFPHTFLSGTLFNGEKSRGASGPGDVCLTKVFAEKLAWVEKQKPIPPEDE
ncbi:hypothetical protein FOA43_001953 [Brettanomyces nanus]|uniref:NADP-dependent oxidoreductase domain-containing protein n=1 Tax=Eeniella nana TaxID=13502 RepID=A0A875RYL6_EENNA|nr:uncharacterized protein FOA43_001953 [Brettanomyces nanus]QPG74621.1 hypothetical protein FOA43_001953 [Brettanomyces nanus]